MNVEVEDGIYMITAEIDRKELMTISYLLEGLEVKKTFGSPDTEIKAIAYDSRQVGLGSLFVAVRGFAVDGHNYIKEALSNGAAAVVAEVLPEDMGTEVMFAEVPDTREALALISAAFYGYPSKNLSLAGITGTNGKTTTGFITKSIMDAGGAKTGLLGTICYMTGDKTVPAVNTTPESLDLQRYLKDMVNNNVKYAVMEVSSHALALKRVRGCSFSVAAFTGFTQDHLDFHGTMAEYFKVKKSIFEYLDTEGAAVLNIDDPMVRALAAELDCRVITCGTRDGSVVRGVNIRERKAAGHELPEGLSFEVKTPWGDYSLDSNLIGSFNVSNMLVSIGIAHALGFSPEVIQQGIKNARPVEGRFESVDAGQDFLCIVDYAHTEDALRKVIAEARDVTKGRVITVFGCGGNRDVTKRPLMGTAAAALSDLVVITSDNPRFEDPEAIIKDILKGVSQDNYIVVSDREEAIAEAVASAEKGDVLVVAGKGHEEYQEIKGVRHHFSDKEILRKVIKKRLASKGQR